MRKSVPKSVLLGVVLLLTMLIIGPAAADHTPDPAGVAIVGNLQSELGCPGDWQPECAATELAYDAGDDVWQATFAVPIGDWEYKAALNDSWDENYGQNATRDGGNIALSLAAPDDVKFYYDHKSHWITDNVNATIATVPGSFQSELGCPGDWQPNCLRSWLQDPDGDGIYSFSTSAIPAGSYEAKVAHDESWDLNFGAGGVENGPNIAFGVPQGATVFFDYDPATHLLSISTTNGLEPGDEALVEASVRNPAVEGVFYFVLPDRFEDGDPSNNTGGIAGGALDHGYLPTDKGYYHGGDLAGLKAKLDYLQGLGVTAIWMTPQFKNNPVQGDGTIGGSSAAYHGYWQIDYTQIDPHFGTNAEMQAFIADAQARGMKVFFDIVLNHTGDVISYEEGTFTYRNKDDYPFRDADGNIFDDRDYAGTGTFPALDPAVSFAYTPIFPDAGDDTAKNPAWLNNPIYYHNRGDSTFTGESSLYGDFFGLDDLFTAHPDVVSGMIDIHKAMITEFGIDGFRVDTVKHVNDELWADFVPAILGHATAEGKTDFFVFGEVFGEDAAFRSRYTTELEFPSVLDFGFDGAAKSFAAYSNPTNTLRDLFASDDYYTDADSNAYALVKFIGNHDIGRFGRDIDLGNPGASDGERVARAELGYALAFFSRGAPLIYYGDEQGFTGDGGDKDARQNMMPSQVDSYNDDDLIGTTATTADSNFDTSHPLYAAFSDFAALRDAHVALQQGAQLHRYSEGDAGIYAFSRIDRNERREYLVVLNNSEGVDGATFATSTPDGTFTELYPGTGSAVAADGKGFVNVSLEGLSVAVYRAEETMPAATVPAGIVMNSPAEGSAVVGRFEVGADVDARDLVEVTFAVSVNGGDYAVIGTDDNAPHRVFYDVSDLQVGTQLTLKAIANRNGELSADTVSVAVGEPPPPPSGDAAYAIIHYFRDDGDYGDHTTGNFNDFWGLHLWGEGIDPSEATDWTSPKPFLGEDEYGRFAWIKLADPSKPVNFIIHRGDLKDGTNNDRSFNASGTPQIWTRQDDANGYASQAEAQGYVTIRYHRPDGNYGEGTPDYWGLHLWGDAIDPSEGTAWEAPKPPTGIDDFGAYWNINIVNANLPVNFIVHKPNGNVVPDTREPGGDRSFILVEDATIWLQAGDEAIYPSRGAAENTVYLRYHRADGDYGDYTSNDYNDFWGMHVWEGALNPNPAWQQPVKPESVGLFGPLFVVPLQENATRLAYILHRGDVKDPGVDQFLNLDKWGYEVWQLEGEGPDPEEPHYVLPLLTAGGPNVGNIDQQRAYWVDEETIAWSVATDPTATYKLHYAPEGGLETGDTGITGGDSITLVPGDLSPAVKDKFPHLADLPALKIDGGDLDLVPEILKGQIAVSAVNGEGNSIDATGLQIPGVLDDLYTYDGELGLIWDGDVPTLRLWAPTAKSVKFHLFETSTSDPAAAVLDMVAGPQGTWEVTGDASWKNKFYLYEVEVYVHSTGQVENNIVTDPYSLSLAMNSTRSQIVDLSDDALKPAGWDMVAKPELVAPEDISIYEIHVRDFSANDPSVPDELKGTFKAFTLENSYGMQHLKALEAAGLSHLHLLPVFDIATINENKAEWDAPDPEVLATYPPDSEQQQAAVTQYENLDGFNWGYDPWHYTTPEGSYSTNPDGTTRIVEFREMVQALNENGLRVVVDVVYNHTNASGQNEKSVLDRVVPGYYHRLNDTGAVEQSTCCENTASEHNMMEKLMVDSLVVWAKEYKVDAFRFDLMGHHMVDNMVAVQEALQALTPENDGVDGSEIYLYGEGWNFGEVADGARGVNATQLNVGGLGIGTFSDRLRDAVRGGGPFDGGQDLIRRQGFANGLYYDPNALNSGSQAELDTLLLLTDQIRVGMAGNLANYEFVDRNGNVVKGSEVDYNGQPAGYTLDPQEDITYISKHDNQTLYDINIYKLPLSLEMQERVRAQMVGLSTVLLGQGVPFTHAGVDLLRSKSMDRDSYNSGDWFNRLDFTYQINNFGVGLPVAGKNQDNWDIMRPLLANPGLLPAQSDIEQSAGLFQELLMIRESSPLFRLQTATEIQERVVFHNTGPDQLPGLVVMSISDYTAVDLDRMHEFIVVLINANDEAQQFTQSGLVGFDLELHPVQTGSIDPLVQTASFDASSGTFDMPGRTAAVFIVEATPQERIAFLKGDVQALIDDGTLNSRDGRFLLQKLDDAIKDLDQGKPNTAINQLNAFVNRVNALMNNGTLTPEQGQMLIEQAESIMAQIEADMP